MQWLILFLVTVGIGTVIITDTHQVVTAGVIGSIFGMLFADFYRVLKSNRRVRRSE